MTSQLFTATPAAVMLLLLQGREYSCYSLAHEGRLVAHADTAAELSNLNYSYEAHAGIRQWVEAFVKKSGASGQVCGRQPVAFHQYQMLRIGSMIQEKQYN